MTPTLRWARNLAATAVARLGARRGNMGVLAGAYVVLGWSLLFQPARWAATPAYHDLLEIMPQQAWGGVFAVIAVALTVSLAVSSDRKLSVVALTLAGMVTTAWAAAFVVRWATSPNTTPETWVSWLTFDWLVIRSWALLDFEEVRVPRRPAGNGSASD